MTFCLGSDIGFCRVKIVDWWMSHGEVGYISFHLDFSFIIVTESNMGDLLPWAFNNCLVQGLLFLVLVIFHLIEFDSGWHCEDDDKIRCARGEYLHELNFRGLLISWLAFALASNCFWSWIFSFVCCICTFLWGKIKVYLICWDIYGQLHPLVARRRKMIMDGEGILSPVNFHNLTLIDILTCHAACCFVCWMWKKSDSFFPTLVFLIKSIKVLQFDRNQFRNKKGHLFLVLPESWYSVLSINRFMWRTIKQ